MPSVASLSARVMPDGQGRHFRAAGLAVNTAAAEGAEHAVLRRHRAVPAGRVGCRVPEDVTRPVGHGLKLGTLLLAGAAQLAEHAASHMSAPQKKYGSMMFVVDTDPASAVHMITAPGEYGAPTSTAIVAIACLSQKSGAWSRPRRRCARNRRIRAASRCLYSGSCLSSFSRCCCSADRFRYW